MEARLARRNLCDAVRTLEGAGLHPFLVDGTLLGAVREGGFMEHDRDLDLGMFIEEYRPCFPRRLGAVGFAHRRTFGTPTRGLELSFRRGGLKLDVFFYYRDPARGQVYHAAWKDGTPIRYGYPSFTLAPLAFLDRTFMAPADPEKFLATKYGPDWRVPVTSWDWAWGPKNATAWVEA